MAADMLTLPLWDQLGPEEADEAARELGRRLPAEFRFQGLKGCTLRQQHHRIAFYQWNKRSFVLIPGADAWLGYDRKHAFQPTDAQREAWEEARRWDENLPELDVYLDIHLTPLRQVHIEPILLEIKATDNPRRTTHAEITEKLA